jgi:hypothetical protein
MRRLLLHLQRRRDRGNRSGAAAGRSAFSPCGRRRHLPFQLDAARAQRHSVTPYGRGGI